MTYLKLLSLFIFLLLSVFLSPSVLATTLPNGFSEIQFATGLSSPTAMEFAPDGRLFIAEKDGKLRIVTTSGQLLTTPFLTVPVLTDGERGLLGITFDPDFVNNRFVYVYYTVDSGSINRVRRYTASSTNQNVAQVGSEQTILDNIPSISGYHNGGAIHFGNDGKLYVAVGEGHTSSNAQNVINWAGKILRINKDGTIPSDNPTSFVNTSGQTLTPTGNNRAIWAIGFRNPFTFAIHPTSGKIYINDVGQGTWEEVNDLAKGANFGWPTCEGTCTNTNALNPLHAYHHNTGGRAITGGTFYEENHFPTSYKGKYFFADYIGNFIKQLNPTNNQVTDFATGARSPVDLKTGSDGALYYLSLNDGAVYKITNTTSPSSTPTPTPTPTSTINQSPIATINTPTNGTVYSGGEVINYSGSGTDSEDGMLPNSAFSWMIVFHHDTHTHPFLGPISATKSGSFTIPKIGETSDNVWYRVHLTVRDSQNATHTVTRDITPQKATITLSSNINGAQVLIDGQPQVAPYVFTGVVGITRNIGVTSPQTLNNKSYEFFKWSDNGTANHDIDFPPTNTTYMVTIRRDGDADVDGNDDIDIFDYNIVVSTFNSTTDLRGDFNNNNAIDIFDYNAVVSNFGT